MKNKTPKPKTKITIAIGKPITGEPMEYGKTLKKASKTTTKSKKKC